MENQDNRPKDAADLRQKAEALARERADWGPQDSATLSPDEIRETLYELRVHQIELEMQNEELRTAQAEIEAGRARYFDLYDLAPVGYCTVSEKGLILEANLTAATLLGTTRGALVTQPISRFIFKEDQDICYLHRKKLFETSEPQKCDLRLVKPDGAHFWAHLTATAAQAEDGAPLCLVVLSAITERKEAEEALKKAKDDYQTITNLTGDIIVQVDKAGRWIFLNDQACEFWGKPREKLIGSLFSDYLHLDDQEETSAITQEMVRSGEPARGLVNRQRTPQGWRIVQWNGIPLYQAGEYIGFQATGRDITDLHEAQEALRVSEERYRTILDIVEEGYWETDLTGKFTFFNDWLLNYLGTSREELLKMDNRSYMTPDSSNKTFNMFNQIYKTEKSVTNVENEIVRLNGEHEFWELSAALMLDREGKPIGFRGTTRDITARKRAEEALRESEDKHRRLFETMAQGVIYQAADGTIISANPAAERILGLSFDQMRGLTSMEPRWKMIREDGSTVPGTEPPAMVALRTGSNIGPVTRGVFHPEKNAHIWLSITAIPLFQPGEKVPFQVYATFTDITGRKRAEDQIRFQAKIIENSPVIAAYHDKDLNVVWVNSAYQKATGLSLEEVRGRKCYQVWNLSKSCRGCPVIKAIETGEFASHELTPDNQDHWPETQGYWLSQAVPVRDEQGTVIGALEFAIDITERKAAEAAQEKLHTQLTQAQKMESIGTLAGGIAHDFNNILSPLMIHAEMALMDAPADSLVKDSLQQIYKAAERARDLVKQILTFARKSDEGRVQIKASLMVKEAIKFLRSSIPTTIDLHYDIRTEQDTVLADPTQFNQIMMNLCTNAAQAMDERGGVIEVILENEDVAPDTTKEMRDLEPGRYVKLTVKDTGQGIEPEILDRIFDPYFTTKEVGKGTGLGLPLVHGIVLSHGGAITVESEVGQGTAFHIYLPLFEGDRVAVKTGQDTRYLPSGTERILFVDDEHAIVVTSQSKLERLGYKVTARTSSIEALEAFRHHPKAFDLVISDMAMPNMSGKELAKELLSIRPDIPVILCTGFSEHIDEHRAKAMGIRALVMKPIVMSQMAITIREVLDEKNSAQV